MSGVIEELHGILYVNHFTHDTCTKDVRDTLISLCTSLKRHEDLPFEFSFEKAKYMAEHLVENSVEHFVLEDFYKFLFKVDLPCITDFYVSVLCGQKGSGIYFYMKGTYLRTILNYIRKDLGTYVSYNIEKFPLKKFRKEDIPSLVETLKQIEPVFGQHVDDRSDIPLYDQFCKDLEKELEKAEQELKEEGGDDEDDQSE